MVHELPSGLNVVVRQVDNEVHVWVVKEQAAQQPANGEEQKKLEALKRLIPEKK